MPETMPHPTVQQTRDWVSRLHADQTDKAGQPYITHLARVVRHLLRLFPKATEAEIHAAWLHDAIEDCDITADTLQARGYTEQTVGIVELVTKDPSDGLTYQQRIEALIATGNQGAMRVKLADLTDNSDPARLALLPEDRAISLGKRYQAALQKLKTALAVD